MLTTRRSGWLVALYLLVSCCAGVSVCALAGCERKETEKVIDVETPGVDVKVERNKDTGKVDVEVERPK
ncbi:MAG: hypothetical protein WD971_04635 [Pirellulales bacterium]